MSVINSIPLIAAGDDGYQISRSVRLRSSATAYFSRTFGATPITRTKQTLSAWVKRGSLGASQAILSGYDGTSASRSVLYFNSSDQLAYDNGGAAAVLLASSSVYRDPSAWYHVLLSIDTTQATAANRVLLFVNGAQLAAFSSANYPAQNATTQLALNNANNFIGQLAAGNWYFDGYLTEINFIDGQALTPSSFGETDAVTGVWKPKKYAGTYGTNGFYLNFSDPSAATAAAIGKDSSGNGNNWTPNNISVTAGVTYDSMLDVPTLYADGGNGRGNYAVLNPLGTNSSGTITISSANLNISASGTAVASSTIGVGNSGKWYAEFQITSTPENNTNELIAIGAVGTSLVNRAYASNGQYFNGSAWVAFGGAWSINDVIGVAFDVDASQVSFYKNGTQQGSTQSYTFSSQETFSVRGRNVGTSTFVANFGQRPFAYTPPTGFRALNTQNLPEPTIKKGSQYFDATTYLGTGGTQTVSNLSFQPDLVWIKNRSAVANHALLDSVRPSGFALYPNLTDAEANNSSLFTGISGNSFSLAGGNVTYNAANNYISWYWKESASAGFDIVTYTGNGVAGRTVAHSLGVAPRMMILKNRTNGSAAYHWFVYHASIGATDRLLLNTTGATATDSAAWNNTAPTSSVFSVGTGIQTNENGSVFVAYLFAEVAGFSKFGSYTGNGSADGPFIFTGFRPRYVMIKNISTTGDWWVVDTARSTVNVASAWLNPNLSNAESSAISIDLISNGFKFRSAAGNDNGQNWIYAAFAEAPFKNSLAR